MLGRDNLSQDIFKLIQLGRKNTKLNINPLCRFVCIGGCCLWLAEPRRNEAGAQTDGRFAEKGDACGVLQGLQ